MRIKEIWFHNIRYIQTAYAIIWLGMIFIGWVNTMDFLFTIEIVPVPNLIPDLFPQCVNTGYRDFVLWLNRFETIEPHKERLLLLELRETLIEASNIGFKPC